MTELATDAGNKIGAEFGPWNPGLDSALPDKLLALDTVFRPENTWTGLAVIKELSDFSGLPRHELAALTPSRLALHELLVRVMADYSVPDGNKYEDLGINFRSMVGTLKARCITPRLTEINAAFGVMQARVNEILEAELSATLFRTNAPTPPPQSARRALFGWRKGCERSAPQRPEAVETRDYLWIEDWKQKAHLSDDPFASAVYAALARVTAAIYRRHGRIIGSRQIITTIAAALVGNGYGSGMIGCFIADDLIAAADRAGFRRLPAQQAPIVLNVKGASASGKSTMRPLQRNLVRTLGVDWEDFALISPDIWRKYLLDYDSLGEARRYAGTLTGHEVAIIDRKLDLYMAGKGESGAMSHLLIDRFRFDSFAYDPEHGDGSHLLTRFGKVVYMCFMITPPEATVERAWHRGEKFGRYKAVEDLLDHNVEAYNGMPRLFFTWALQQDKQMHYEFLDNSVPEGQTPRTVAFGSNGEFTVLDVRCLIDAERYAKINIAALAPGEVYASGEANAPERNCQFLRQCALKLPALNFADFATGRIYARLEGGTLTWTDTKALEQAMSDAEVRAGLLTVVPEIASAAAGTGEARFAVREGSHTLGAWGS